MHRSLYLALSFLVAGNIGLAQETSDATDVLFILDGSGSMWGRVDDVEKIVVAKEVMTGLINGLPAEVDAGLITYGHRTRGSCTDIEVIATPGQTDRSDLLTALAGVTPVGKTPISDSLLTAGALVRETEDPVSIVLVSDGIESCEGDPCATAALLREQDVDVQIHVVGFDVDPEAEAQLSCIANAGGGNYYQASSADALIDALADVRVSILDAPAIAPQPDPIVEDPNIRLAEDVIGGVDVINAETGDVVLRLAGQVEEEIPHGSYQFGFDNFTSSAIPIEAGVNYIISAAQFGLSVVQLDGAQLRNVDVRNAANGEKVGSLSQTVPELFPAGSYQFVFDNFTSPPVTIAANESYVISPSDFAQALVAMDGTQLKNVRIVDVATGDVVAMMSGTRPERILPGTYLFRFVNFTSPPFVVEPDGDYTISPADYGLAQVVLDGSEDGGVNVVDPDSGERIVRLAGASPQLIPPGTYVFGFDHYLSPSLVVDPGSDHVISAAEYGLTTVRLAESVGRPFLLLQVGQEPINLRDGRARQIGPGPYARVFDGVELGIVDVAPNAEMVIAID